MPNIYIMVKWLATLMDSMLKLDLFVKLSVILKF